MSLVEQMELLKMTESTMKINFFFLNVLSSTGGQKIQLVVHDKHYIISKKNINLSDEYCSCSRAALS